MLLIITHYADMNMTDMSSEMASLCMFGRLITPTVQTVQTVSLCVYGEII